MRLNRGTLVMIALLVVVIAAVLVINNQQTTAPTPTATLQEATGSLLPNVAGESVVSYEVRDNASGTFIALTKDAGGAWHIDATNALSERDPEQSLINSTVGQLTNIKYNNIFQNSELATFGLDHPAYTILVTTSDGQLYTIYIGSKSPTSSRYYTVVQQSTAPEATELPGAEATPEATASVASKRIVRLAQAATPEATAEMTAEATIEAAAEMTPEATAEATVEATPEATADVIQNPGVTLEGEQTVYLIPQTVIDTLKGWLTMPPYAPLPTAVPTNEGGSLLPIPEIGATSAPGEATAEATAAS